MSPSQSDGRADRDQRRDVEAEAIANTGAVNNTADENVTNNDYRCVALG